MQSRSGLQKVGYGGSLNSEKPQLRELPAQRDASHALLENPLAFPFYGNRFLHTTPMATASFPDLDDDNEHHRKLSRTLRSLLD